MASSASHLSNVLHNLHIFVRNGNRNKQRNQLSPAEKLSSRLVAIKINRSALLRSKALDLASEIDHFRTPASLTGIWKKDRDASDGMKEACDLVALSFILRRAITLLNTFAIEDSSTHFKTTIKAGGVLDVRESYPKTGEIVLHSRRDKRSGSHRGRVIYTEQGHPCIEATWDDPYGGECWDVFILSPGDDNVLEQHTEMKMINGKGAKYKTVYRRVRS